MATNFLKYCTGSANGMALAVGVSGVECAAGIGMICIRLGEGVTGSEPRGKWFKNRLLGLFYYFLPTAFLSQQ